MERSFIATKESEYFKDRKDYLEKAEQQRLFVKNFSTEKGIEGTSYRFGGDGSVNQPFDECWKEDIKLSIIPNENDKIKFKKMLCKPNEYKLCTFKKSSIIAKEFAQKCIDEKVIINLYPPRISDYFVSLGNGLYGCSSQTFTYNDNLYIKLVSEHLTIEDTPKGFNEIKLSEYYKVVENLEEK